MPYRPQHESLLSDGNSLYELDQASDVGKGVERRDFVRLMTEQVHPVFE
jgi:hypothetical protein